ncbi:hypothetical protein F5Y04DRAFT_255590 [Hypomontagnella monticulosa]|nr:hypothetical protein F5Y04DRAFT_255590 [Hypomontagnella monticulosa]
MIVSGNIVWRARIALKKKLALAFICSLTFVVIVISIIRLIRVAGTADISRLVLWNSLEMTIGKFPLIPLYSLTTWST